MDLVVVDALAGGRLADARRLLGEYLDDTREETGWPPPGELPAPVRRELDRPGDVYRPPGSLFVALVDGEAVGCVGLRPHDARTGEIKRLFVRPGHRRAGVAAALEAAARRRALEAGMSRLLLDVVPSRDQAVAWYRRLGYTDTEPYTTEPVPVVYLACDLPDPS